MMAPCLAQAQADTARIQVRARVQPKAILLRWAATTPMAWKQTNRYGFKLERYTVVRKGEILPQAELKEYPPIKAQPLNSWQAVVERNDYAAIIAQALYGEGFQLNGGQSAGVASIINLSQEQDQRFALSLYAADQSFEAAIMAGWGFQDNEVQPGERYLYRVTPLTPEGSKPSIEMGSVYVSLDQYQELPQPIGLSALFADRSVTLSWDYSLLSDTYNSYFIEKSTDGQQFTRLDGLPLTHLSQNERSAQRMYYVDSLASNNTKLWYRVCGTNAFGEQGPASSAVEGQGRAALGYVPQITRAEVNNEGQLELDWEFDERGNALISGFELHQSAHASKGFAPVMQTLPASQRSLRYPQLNATNYFTIVALGADGRSAESFPVLVQPLDTLPPAIPAGLQGSIDSTGVVRLHWRANTETDMLGYKLYRGFTASEERQPLFDNALRDTIYHDTVNVQNLNSKVYYSLSAVDARYNQSNQSAPLVLEKPDFIRPSSPVIAGYKITDAGIEISWINSPDEGVSQHRIYRAQKDGMQSPRLLATIADTSVHTYTDTDIVAGQRYSYTVTALKRNWLESEPSPAVSLFSNKARKQAAVIDRFDAVLDKPNRMLRLEWKDRLANVVEYQLYRSEDNQPMALWKTLPPDQHQVMDQGLQVNTKYQYMMRAMLPNGSTPVKKLTINY